MPDFCCPMRAKYLLGIVAEATEIPQPVEAADFIDFDMPHPEGKLVIKIKYCPFCGKAIDRGPVRTV